MKTPKLTIILMALAIITACNEESSTQNSPETCTGDACQTTPPMDDTQLCGGQKCSTDEICMDEKCAIPEVTCEEESCGPETEDELCGGKQCSINEICQNEICVPDNQKTCDANPCSENEICHEGTCIPNTDGCNPACNEDQWCDEGECVYKEVDDVPPTEATIPPEIIVTQKTNLVTRRSGDTAEFGIAINQSPSGNIVIPIQSLDQSLGTVSPEKLTFNPENWENIQMVTITGTPKATVQEQTYQIQIGPAQGDGSFAALDAIKLSVTHIDDMTDKSCKSSETKDDAGKCISVPVTSIKLKKSSYNVLRDQTVKLEVIVEPSNATNQELTWKFVNTTKAKHDDTIGNMIEKTPYKDTRTMDVKGISKGARDIQVTVTSKSNKSLKATANLKIKPYYPLVDYEYMFGGDKPKRALTYNKEKPKSDDLKCRFFTESTTHVFNHDLYTDIVRPKMMRVNGKFYATRASVVAAARFLTMQFPYDIPYYTGDYQYSHYAWIKTDKAKQGCEARIYGLNLRSKAYNNYNDDTKDDAGNYLYTKCPNSNGEYITTVRNDGTPWACQTTVNNETITVGLECSGLVTWALRNGRFNLGDWRSIFYRADVYYGFYNREYTGEDKDARNYQLEDFIYSTCLLYNDKKTKCIIPGSNANNIYDNLKSKFETFNPQTDILEISKMNDEDFKSIKAGDLLQPPKYYCKCKLDKDSKCTKACQKDGDKVVTCNKTEPNCIKKSGHIAMIIAIDKNKSGKATGIYVGEASSVGNRVTKFNSWKELASGKTSENNISGWSKTYLYPSYVIKMDHIYDYHTRNNKLKDEDGKPLDGNTYKYTDIW